MDEVLFGVFAENIGRYLDSVDRLAAAVHQATYANELRRLSDAWRALLELHRPTGRRGRCVGCDPPRPALAVRRGGTAMCTVWRVANAYFVRGLPE